MIYIILTKKLLYIVIAMIKRRDFYDLILNPIIKNYKIIVQKINIFLMLKYIYI